MKPNFRSIINFIDSVGDVEKEFKPKKVASLIRYFYEKTLKDEEFAVGTREVAKTVGINPKLSSKERWKFYDLLIYLCDLEILENKKGRFMLCDIDNTNFVSLIKAKHELFLQQQKEADYE